MVTIIRSKVEKEINGKKIKVPRYQVVDGEWNDSMELPTPASLTFNFNKAREVAKKMLMKKFCKIVNTEKQYNESDIVHVTPEQIEEFKAKKAAKQNKKKESKKENKETSAEVVEVPNA